MSAEFVKSDCGLLWAHYLEPFGLAKTEPVRVPAWVQHVIDALDGVSYVMPGYRHYLNVGHSKFGVCFDAWAKTGFSKVVEASYALGGVTAVRAVVLPALSGIIPRGAKVEVEA